MWSICCSLPTSKSRRTAVASVGAAGDNSAELSSEPQQHPLQYAPCSGSRRRVRLALLLPGVASLLAAVMGCFFVHRFGRLAANEAVAPTSYDLNRILGALVVTGSFALVGLCLVVLSLFKKS